MPGIQSHGESPDSVLNWTPTNPNQVDSDGDSLQMAGRQDILQLALIQFR